MTSPITTTSKSVTQFSGREIFVLDDDVAVGQVLKNLLSMAGYKVTCFNDITVFLSAVQSNPPSCIILDVIIPGKSGIDILEQIKEGNDRMPIFMMSGGSNIAMAVDAMKKGAWDFFEKPFANDKIISSIRSAIDEPQTHVNYQTHRNGDNAGASEKYYSTHLTSRERAVLDEIIKGSSNKDVGGKLGISSRTVEFHRANLMAKLGARNTADLIRMTLNRPAYDDRVSI